MARRRREPRGLMHLAEPRGLMHLAVPSRAPVDFLNLEGPMTYPTKSFTFSNGATNRQVLIRFFTVENMGMSLPTIPYKDP